MFLSCYHELCKTFDSRFDVLVIIGIFGYCVNADIAVHRLGDEFDRRDPEIYILVRRLDVFANFWI